MSDHSFSPSIARSRKSMSLPNRR